MLLVFFLLPSSATVLLFTAAAVLLTAPLCGIAAAVLLTAPFCGIIAAAVSGVAGRLSYRETLASDDSLNRKKIRIDNVQTREKREVF